MIKAVLFDFDDTLGNRNEYAYLYYESVIDRFAHVDDLLLKQAMANDLLMWDAKGEIDKNICLTKFNKKYHQNVQLDMNVDYNAYIGDYACAWENAEATILELKKKYKVGILTNGPSVAQHNKVKNAFDSAIFDLIVVSGDTPYKKPQKQIYEWCASLLNCECNEIVMIGDNFANDVYGALKAGCNAMWLCQERGVPTRNEIIALNKIEDCLNYL